MIIGDAGPVYVKSSKQKIVTKSTTESELVALSDSGSHGFHLRNFLIGQGYKVKPVRLLQDNMSTIALIGRGGPASERSRHIDIRYFWLSERVKSKEATVEHCSTKVMWANLLTKPLQGQQFIYEQNELANWRGN